MKNVIVLPGTRWQIPLVQKLKNRGYYVIVFDYYENQPAYEYADEHCIVNILDKEKVFEFAESYNPEAIVSDECDIATPTIAWVSEKLGKPSIGTHMAELFTNKYLMREFGRRYDFAIPEYFKCSNINDALKVYHDFGKKMIMKPLDANSSRGIYSVESDMDIITNFAESLSYSKLERSVLLEEFIDGEEFSVDGMKIGAEFFSLAISKKYHFSYNENLDQALLFTNDSKEYDYDELRKVNENFVMRSGLSFGLTHAEYKFYNGRFYMIEIGARGGGNLISSIINPELTGIDTQEYLIDWALGNEINAEAIKYSDNYKDRCAWLCFFDTQGREGVLKEIVGVDILKNINDIKSYYFFYDIGSHIGQAKDGGTRLGYYIACCDSIEKLKEIQAKVNENIQIIIE